MDLSLRGYRIVREIIGISLNSYSANLSFPYEDRRLFDIIDVKESLKYGLPLITGAAIIENGVITFGDYVDGEWCGERGAFLERSSAKADDDEDIISAFRTFMNCER